MQNLHVLPLQPLERLLSFPYPWLVGREEQVHFLKRAFLRFRIETIHDGNRQEVDASVDEEGVL